MFQVRDKRLAVLLWRRAKAPFEGAWVLPGGPLAADERLGASASRHLAAKVDIPEIAHLEQLETRSDPVRDPRGRVLATAYLALVTPVNPCRLLGIPHVSDSKSKTSSFQPSVKNQGPPGQSCPGARTRRRSAVSVAVIGRLIPLR